MITRISRYANSYVPFWLAVIILAGVAIGINTKSYVSIDNGWLLVVAERLLAGERLYIDLLETNPPLIVWLNTLPILLSQWLGWHPETGLLVCVLLLLWLVMALCARVVRRHPVLAPPMVGNTVLIAVALGLFSCSSFVFGQREHLWVILIAPYLLQSLALVKEPPPTIEHGVIALLAAVGFALKPYFLIVWVVNELYLAYGKRRWGVLLRRTNIVIAVCGGAYFIASYILYPAYFESILPLLLTTYGDYAAPSETLLRAVGMLCLLYIPAALLVRKERGLASVSHQLVVLWLAACLVPLMQHKGWYNHYYPLLVFGGVLASVTLLRVLLPLIRIKQAPGRLQFAGLCAAFFMLTLPPVSEPIRLWHGKHSDVVLEQLRTKLDEHVAGQGVMVLSFNLSASFPLLNYVNATQVGRFGQLWPLPAVLRHEIILKNKELPMEIANVKAFVVDSIVNDMKNNLPAAVIVDNNTIENAAYAVDLVSYFKQDPRFQALWAPYTELTTIKDVKSNASYTLYIRQ